MPAGYYNTDLGGSLQGYVKDHLGAMDSRTNFIIVGMGATTTTTAPEYCPVGPPQPPHDLVDP
jgi:hypothetical protein